MGTLECLAPILSKSCHEQCVLMRFSRPYLAFCMLIVSGCAGASSTSPAYVPNVPTTIQKAPPPYDFAAIRKGNTIYVVPTAAIVAHSESSYSINDGRSEWTIQGVDRVDFLPRVSPMMVKQVLPGGGGLLAIAWVAPGCGNSGNGDGVVQINNGWGMALTPASTGTYTFTAWINNEQVPILPNGGMTAQLNLQGGQETNAIFDGINANGFEDAGPSGNVEGSSSNQPCIG